jgi:hypothetical protein
MKKDKRLFILNKNKYFPQYLEVNLLVCSKECAHAYLGPSKFKHICDCGLEFKKLYNLKYVLLDIFISPSSNIELMKFVN